MTNAIQAFKPEQYDPVAGPNNQKQATVMAGVLATALAGITLWQIFTHLTLAMGVAGLVSSGVGIAVIFAAIAVVGLWTYFNHKNATVSQTENETLKTRVIELQGKVAKLDKQKKATAEKAKKAASAPSTSWLNWSSGTAAAPARAARRLRERA